MVTGSHAAEIGAHDIGKDFGSFTALNNISITIGRGEFLTLLGPSGSGKTTFLMTLAGFELPTRGSLTLDGNDVTNLPAEQRAFGMVFQGYALFPHMTVEQNISFPLRVKNRQGSEIRRRVAEMIEMVGLGGHGHKRPAALSGGQQQRVALARALIYEPPVLLLDEPFSALDKNLRGQMQEEVSRLHKETGTTFVFVTHDQSEALALSSRIAIFEQGELQQIGSPKEVYDEPSNRFVAEFLGDINILPINATRDNGSFVEAQFEDLTLRASSHPGGSCKSLAIRPEYMRLSSSRPTDGNAISATVTGLTYLGAQLRLALRTNQGTDLTLVQSTANITEVFAAGDQVWAGWHEENGIFL